MNNINEIAFDIYYETLDLSYGPKLSFYKKIKKFVRYLRVGYLFKRKINIKKMNKINEFKPTQKIFPKKKLVVYTVCIGSYDVIKNPIYIDDNIDYFIFTDQNLEPDSIWRKIDINNLNYKDLTIVEKTRFVKLHPELFFKEYDYSLYIDSNVRITCDIRPVFYSFIESEKVIGIHRHQCRDCIYDEAKAIYADGKAKYKDIKKQVIFYKKEKFPYHYGLFENNIIFRDHNSSKCIKVMEEWWDQIKKFDTKRDQLSLMYCLWKNQMTIEDVFSLGNNSRRNPYFIVKNHK